MAPLTFLSLTPNPREEDWSSTELTGGREGVCGGEVQASGRKDVGGRVAKRRRRERKKSVKGKNQGKDKGNTDRKKE